MKKYIVGDVEVIRISEIVFHDFSASFLFPDWDANVLDDKLAWMTPGCVNKARSMVTVNIHTWLLKTPKHIILIDTGIGNGRTRTVPMFNQLNTPYLDRLAQAGVGVDQVDYVMCTHLHSDHVGWNTCRRDGKWVPTFPNARYVFPQRELEQCQSGAREPAQAGGIYEDAILPVLESQQVDLVGPEGGESIDGLTFYPTPGHTAGHMSIGLAAQGEQALFTGDVVHNPIQIYRPRWNSAFCEDAAQARSSREWMLAYAVAKKALLFTAHFPESSAGYIAATEKGFDWRFA